MNKKAIIIALLLFAIIIVGFLIYYVSLPKEYIQITYEEYKQLEESDEKFVLFIGASTCSHCTTYKKTINRVVKDYHIKVYYIDINLLEEEEHAHPYIINAGDDLEDDFCPLIASESKEKAIELCIGNTAYKYFEVVYMPEDDPDTNAVVWRSWENN